MRVAILVVSAGLAGCVDTEQTPVALDARSQFVQNAWPALSACVGCHGTQPTIDFLAPGTADGAYDQLLAFQPAIVDLATPSASLLVTMGKHTGPAMDAMAEQTVLTWLDQEQKERVAPPTEAISVGPIDISLGMPVSIDLPAGGKLGFVASSLSGGLYLSQLAIVAGPQGLHVAHPLFVTHPAKLPAVVDELDRFGDVDVKLAGGESLALGGGDALFLEFSPSAPLTIHFHTLEAP
jgi:hypothetical protein